MAKIGCLKNTEIKLEKNQDWIVQGKIKVVEVLKMYIGTVT